MRRSLKSLRGYTIVASDGEIGKIHEFLFDDHDWVLRYLVVDTGTWLPGRKVLLWPGVLGRPEWSAQALPVALTKSQVEDSPPIRVDEPVSRQKESDLHTYYGWPPYWRQRPPMSGPESGATDAALAAAKAEMAAMEAGSPDPHLRSSREVIGYHIEARDGEIGHVEDLIVNDDDWLIQYLVVDTRNWLPGRKVLVSPTWAEEISWLERKVRVDLSKDTIENSPEFDPTEPVNRSYEERLYDYYGRPKYWR